MNGEHTKPVEARTEDLVGKNEPAYPVADASCCQYGGLSKRELFAAMAMQGMMANPNHAEFIHSHAERASLAGLAADALLKELSR